MLVLSRKINEVIVVNDVIRIKIISTSSDSVKVGIDAPRNVAIYREEIWKSIQAENISAAQADSQNVSQINKKLFQLKNKDTQGQTDTPQ